MTPLRVPGPSGAGCPRVTLRDEDGVCGVSSGLERRVVGSLRPSQAGVKPFESNGREESPQDSLQGLVCGFSPVGGTSPIKGRKGGEGTSSGPLGGEGKSVWGRVGAGVEPGHDLEWNPAPQPSLLCELVV